MVDWAGAAPGWMMTTAAGCAEAAEAYNKRNDGINGRGSSNWGSSRGSSMGRGSNNIIASLCFSKSTFGSIISVHKRQFSDEEASGRMPADFHRLII